VVLWPLALRGVLYVQKNHGSNISEVRHQS
jgi:hypothetical protein